MLARAVLTTAVHRNWRLAVPDGLSANRKLSSNGLSGRLLPISRLPFTDCERITGTIAYWLRRLACKLAINKAQYRAGGLFEEWQTQIAEVSLVPGDTLILYTDGITEAVNQDGEEFGEGRLVNALLSHGRLPVPQLLQCVFDEVGQFSRGEQQDDITVVIARSLP